VASLGNIGIGLTLGSGQFIGGLNRATEAVTGFTNHVHARFAGLNIGATGFAGVALGMAAGMVKLATTAVETAAHFEDLRVTFEALTGSAERGQKLLAELTDLAVRTPFQLTDLTKGAQQLLAFGFNADEARGMLERLGDVAAASPGGMGEGLQHIIIALGQIRGAGRVMGQEMRQLINSNIPAWEALANELGTDVAGAMARVRAGTVDARTGIMAILHLAESPRFAGLMEKRAQTLNGLISTMKDSITIFMRDLGEVIIQGFDLKFTTRQLTDFVNHVRASLDGLRPALMMIGALFGALRDTVVTVLKDIVSLLRNWGVTLDGGANNLAKLRAAAIDTFETVAKWINTGLNLMVRFGGGVLTYVVAPLMKAAQEILLVFAKLARALDKPDLAESLVNLAGGMWLPRARAELIGKQLMEQPLDAGADAIAEFFNRVRATGFDQVAKGFTLIADAVTSIGNAMAFTLKFRQDFGRWHFGAEFEPARWVGKALGVAQQLGAFGPAPKAPFNLDIPGMGGAKPSALAPAALFDSAEAAGIINKDWLQRQGGGAADKQVAAIDKVRAGIDQVRDINRDMLTEIRGGGFGII
jgi:tape measure domain-containing protein